MINDSNLEHESHDATEVNSMNGKNKMPNKFEEEFEGWLQQLEQEIKSTRKSEQLTEKDYSIRINAKD